MRAPWKPLLVVAALAAAARAADPSQPVQLPPTPIEVLAVVHGEAGDDAAIKKLKESGARYAPGAPELRQLRQLGVPEKVLAAVTVEPQQATPAPKVSRPVGTWVREVGPMRVVMKFTEDRLTVTANVPGPEDDEVVVTADADYSVNPEGLLFGVISGIDADAPEAGAELQMMTGHTFSARCRVDGTTMTVKDVKAFGSGLNRGEMDEFAGAMIVACGRYIREDNAKPPTPRKAKARGEKSTAAGAKLGSAVGSLMGQPACQVPPPPVAPAPTYAVFGPAMLPPGAMLQPPPYLPPPPMDTPPGMVNQAGWTAYPSPPPRTPEFPPPPMLTAPTALPSRLVGSWVRDTDGVQVVAKFTEKRAFLTANFAFLEDKQEHRMTVRFEADYAVGPDGTAFGVITAADLTPPKGAGSRDTESELRQLAAMTGAPFCFRFRLDEGNLTVRDLRCGEFAGHDFAVRNSDAMMLLGRYKPAGNQEPSPPKPVKMKVNDSCPNCPPLERIGIDFDSNIGGAGGMTLPPPHYLKHYPQYFPPDPAFPLQLDRDPMIQIREQAPTPRPAARH